MDPDLPIHRDHFCMIVITSMSVKLITTDAGSRPAVRTLDLDLPMYVEHAYACNHANDCDTDTKICRVQAVRPDPGP